MKKERTAAENESLGESVDLYQEITGKPITRVIKRLITPPGDEQKICFQHSVICQTGMPYRDPGNDVQEWQRDQGSASLLLVAGKVQNPESGKWENVGLPWGTKARLILAHLNAEALRQQSPMIEVEGSLSAFVRRIRGFSPGREITAFKQQLTRLANAKISLSITKGKRAFQSNTNIISAFELWLEKDDRQRVLWPTTIQLSADYFKSLQDYAVPLNESDLAALAHSAMALDIYAWLAQRLHRIPVNDPARISWAALKAQFGYDYARERAFRNKFKQALQQVKTRYNRANIDLDEHGMIAHTSPPPVAKRSNSTITPVR